MLETLFSFVRKCCSNDPSARKQDIVDAVAKAFSLTKHRSIYACPEFAIRFSSAKGSSFSNTVASLAALQSFDAIPFVVCVIRPSRPEFLLSNTTFLKKISHSSHQLRVDNIRGSFLGHDIKREYEGIPNTPENFDRLFSIHQEFTWEENLERLV